MEMILKFDDAARFVSLFAFCFAFFTMFLILCLAASAFYGTPCRDRTYHTGIWNPCRRRWVMRTFNYSERPAGSRTRYVPFGKGTLYR